MHIIQNIFRGVSNDLKACAILGCGCPVIIGVIVGAWMILAYLFLGHQVNNIFTNVTSGLTK